MPTFHLRTQMLTNRLIILLFCLAISLPVIKQLSGPRAIESKTEQRLLAEWPALRFDRQTIEAFPKGFERYFNDHFGYRDQLIFGHHYLKAMVFNLSPVDKVLMGKDGWLYFTIKDQIKDHQGILRYIDQDLAGITNNLQTRQDTLGQLGMNYLLVLAPNKQSIYPEFLPGSVVKVGNETRLDQLVDYLKNNSSVNVLDLRGPLLTEKSKMNEGELLYLTQDTHWNQRGAFVAYQAIMEAVRPWYPELRTLADSDVDVETKPSVRGDLANMIGMKEVLQEQAPFPTVKSVKAQRDSEHDDFLGLFAGRYREDYRAPFMTRCDAAKKRAVVFRDSFFSDIVPFVEESFQHITYIYEQYNEGIMIELLSRNLKPDLVIEEIVERDL